MKLSHLIAKLIDMEVDHGELDVVIRDDDDVELQVTGASVMRETGYGGDKVLLETELP